MATHLKSLCLVLLACHSLLAPRLSYTHLVRYPLSIQASVKLLSSALHPMSQRTFFFSDSSNWNIVIGSIRGILGVALLTVTIFFIRRARQKYPLLEEASISDFSTDNANQTKCSSKLETVEQRKGTDNEGKMVDNVRRTEAVRVIAMDDSKSSFAQQGVETVNENSLPTRIV